MKLFIPLFGSTELLGERRSAVVNYSRMEVMVRDRGEGGGKERGKS
jgi:hypothetical protein